MKILIKTILFCSLSSVIVAQTQQEPSLQDIQRELSEMQRRMFDGFKQQDMLSRGFSNPGFQWDTTFTLRLDTLSLDGWSGKYFLSPFGQDSMGQRDFWGNVPFPEVFREFFGLLDNPLSESDENSALDMPDDGLLPEERLRKSEEKAPAPSDAPAAPAPKKPNIKTIRI